MFAKGSTAIDGLSGNGNGGGEAGTGALMAAATSRTRYTRTGRAMFFTLCSPRSSKAKSSLSRT